MSADIIQARYEQIDAIAERFANSAQASAELHKRIIREESSRRWLLERRTCCVSTAAS